MTIIELPAGVLRNGKSSLAYVRQGRRGKWGFQVRERVEFGDQDAKADKYRCGVEPVVE